MKNNPTSENYHYYDPQQQSLRLVFLNSSYRTAVLMCRSTFFPKKNQ